MQEALLSDASIAPFLQDSFDVASFTSSALKKGSSAEEFVEEISSQIKRIEQAIASEVSENQLTLITNVRRSAHAEGQLQVSLHPC